MKPETHLPRLFAVFLFALLLSLPLLAAELSAAKADGYLGEQPNGYLGLVDNNAPAHVRELMAEVNAKRRANYERIASQQGIPVAEVEKVAGRKAIEKTRPGNYIQGPDGSWVRK